MDGYAYHNPHGGWTSDVQRAARYDEHSAQAWYDIMIENRDKWVVPETVVEVVDSDQLLVEGVMGS